MKTDDFDEIFRRKVESYHPPFEDTEIDRIQGYVKQKMPLSWWQQFGNSLIYSLGSIIIVSLLSTIVYQTNENKILLENIEKLKSELTQKQSSAFAPKDTTIDLYSKVYVEKIDTIYIHKTIEKVIDFSEDVTEKLAIQASASNLRDNQFSTNLSVKKEAIRQKDAIVESKERPKNELMKSISETQPNVLASEVVSNSEKSEFTRSLKDIQIDELSYKVFGEYSFPRILSIVNFWEKPSSISLEKGEKKRFSINFPSIHLPKPKVRIGLGGVLDNTQRGVNISSEILLAKKISLTSGLGFGYMSEEHFRNEYEFNRKNVQDFREQHPLEIGKNIPIHEIDAKKYIIQMPIMLNYRMPLKKDFTAIISTGTSLDLHLRQFTTYSHGFLEEDDEESHLNQEVPTKIFNNWLVSFGLEKRWNRMSVQLNPYYGFQIKKLPYQIQNNIFGLRMNVFYRLGK